jgi:ribonucleoside-diphosphate reductase alpha chain
MSIKPRPDSIDAAAAYVVEHEHELPGYFISAMSISAEQHVHVLAAAQRNVDNSVSKTCNGASTTPSSRSIISIAWRRQLGCKAVSYYRDGSREGQVLTSMKSEAKTETPTVVTTTTIIEPLEETAPIGTESENEAAARRLAEAEAAARKQGAIRLERPRELRGATWRIPFDGQNLYVTVNHDDANDSGSLCHRTN